jgi:hypothetical protein
MRKTIAIMSLLATSLLSAGAFAQPEGAPPAAPAPEGAPPAAPAPEGAAPEAAAPAPAAAPAAAAGDASGLTLSAGAAQVTVPVVLNLSKDLVLKPVMIPLDLRYGVTNELTAFVSHTEMGMSLATGGGVCLGGKDRGCSKFYNNVAIGGMYSLMKNNGLELAGLVALDLRSIDPMHLAIDVGVAVKYVSAPISVSVTPTFGIGANKRDEGNKEKIAAPVQIAFQASSELAVFLDSGIVGYTKDFSKNYRVPVGVGAGYTVQPGLVVGAEFIFPMLVAGDAWISDVKGANSRAAMLFASYRTK